MKADHESYARASSTCLLGLGLQVVGGGTLLTLGILARDQATISAAYFVLLGVPLWIGLAILFDQHRRERIEALEADALASDSGASVFESSGEEFRAAARRLATVQKYFLPALSLAYAAALIGLGIWRLQSASAQAANVPATPNLAGWSLGVGVGLGVLGFVLARFVAGMSRQKVWQNLRGGAGAATGMSLFGLAIGIGALVAMAGGGNVVVKILHTVFPVAMLILGVEVVLTFLLDLYRPRKAGEIARPAFDSRILSFVAMPDTIARSIGEAINYQLGYDVTGNWFYQLVSRLVLPLVALGTLIVWGLSTMVVVQPHERGAILRFGSVLREVGPGLHFKMPWPIDSLYLPTYTTTDARNVKRTITTATGLRLIQLGSIPSNKPGPILWTNEHAGEEVMQIVQPTVTRSSERFDARAGSESATELAAGAGSVIAGEARVASEVGLVAMELPLQYAVRDVVLFESLAPPDKRDDVLKSAAQRAVVRSLSSLSVDDILHSTQEQIGGRLKRAIEEEFSRLNPDPKTREPRGAGVEIISLMVTKAHPPKEAAPAFERVVQAEQRRRALSETTEADRIERLTRVAGSVSRAELILGEIAALEALVARRASEQEIIDQRFKLQQMIEQSGGEAAQTIAGARAERWARHMGERGRALRYAGQLAAYDANPSLFVASRLFEAMKQGFASSRLYVSDVKTQGRLEVEVDVTDEDSRVEIFRPEGSTDR
ncbi:MAG: SPFH domain-containing protein [Planctomycetota bacterium]|nr:SPFH domain-containing protein [Planctomycetota bacterium]